MPSRSASDPARHLLATCEYPLVHHPSSIWRVAGSSGSGVWLVAVMLFGGMLAKVRAEEQHALSMAGSQSTIAAFEPGEDRPGGALTATSADARAIARFPVTAREGGDLDFAAGGAVFRKIWVSAPASTTSSSGLGPLYNARSCEQCHAQAGRGGAPRSQPPDIPTPALVLRLSVPPRTEADRAKLATRRATVIGEPVYGVQLQTTAIQGHAREGQLAVTYMPRTVVLDDGEIVELQAPTYRITAPGYGPLPPAQARARPSLARHRAAAR